MRTTWLCGFAAMSFGTGAFAAGLVDPPKVSIPEMERAPALDGVIEEAEWRDAVGNYGFVTHGGTRLQQREARFWLGRRRETLYIAVRSETPPEGEILTRVRPDGTRDMSGAFHDDSIELVLDPRRGRKPGDRLFYHLIFNANGALYDLSLDPDSKTNPKTLAWRLPTWEMKNRVHDGWWDVEVAIPFSSLGADKRDLATPWGVRIARNWKRPFAQSQWSSQTLGGYLNTKTMPVVTWDDRAPVVQVLSLRDEGKPVIRVRVRNPHARPIEVAVYLQDAWHRDPHQMVKKTVTLVASTEHTSETTTVVASSEQTFELSSSDGGPNGDHRTIINVTSPDGARTYYYRDFTWNLHRPKDVWQVGKRESRKIDLKFKYYPYYSKIRVWVNARGLKNARVTGASAEVVELAGAERKPGKRYWSGRLEFEDGIADSITDIPELPDGDYRLVVRLDGEKVPDAPVVQDFVRKHFEWEHNRLGISDKVIPPFTPLEVDGHTVKCVLRNLTHGDAGLWRRVVSQGKDVLSGPMRWEAELADGSKPGVKGGGWEVTSCEETEVLGKASWRAGPLHAELTTQYDYDGMMKCALALQPCGVPIKRLTLRMPLADRRAGFMHACGDGMRHNYAGDTPTGTGTVWDSSQGNKVKIVGMFYPYIWVGDGERGVCWFADTDRDWILDEETPVIDLVREGETLWLSVHFITRPGRLEREHKIVFGLQVTPTKPMPEGWRRWTLTKKVPGGRPVRSTGSCLPWGSHHNTLYPLEKDFGYFEEMKRLREKGGSPDARTKAFLKNWDKKLARHIPKDDPFFGKIARHTRAGMSNAAACPWKDGWRCVAYTNARGISFLAEEFATFQDEWLNFAFFGRDWDPAKYNEYDVTPSRSLRDCALWYYRKLLTCFDGVYWDDLFLAARYDPVVGDGTWTDEKGRVHPGLGLFALRDLIKRTAVLFHQEGQKLPPGRVPLIMMGHMTNANLVPVLSFLNCTYDWEWRTGYEDFQDRFTSGLTVAETIGRQVGAWPTILRGGHWGRDDPRFHRLQRSRLGVCLVHELWPSDWSLPKEYVDLYERLFQFGYGRPECKVYNYWQEDHPATVTGGTVVGKTLVISKPGAAIVAITDYGEGGPRRMRLDLAKLGLAMDVAAADLETGKTVHRVSAGEFELEIPKHGLRMIRVSQQR